MFHSTTSNSSPTPQRPHRPDDIAEDPEGESKPAETIDLLALIPLTEAHRHLPRRADGKKVHRTTLGRWAAKGCRGRVLRTWLVGGIRYTSLEAIAEFILQPTVSAPPAGRSMPPPPEPAAPARIPDTNPSRTGRPSTRRDRIEDDLERFGL